jgi:hypothetical protein
MGLRCIATIAPDVTHDIGIAIGSDIFHSHVGSPLACQQSADLAHAAWYRPLRRLVQSAGRHRRIAARAAEQFGAAESQCIALSHRGPADLTTLHGVSPGRIRLVPNGVDTERFNPARHRDAGAALRRRCGFAPDDVVVIGVAHSRRLIRGRHPGKVRDLAGVGPGAGAVGVLLPADLDRGREVHDEEPAGANPFRGLLPHRLVGATKAASTTSPASLKSRATSTPRRRFSLRSSAEKPRSRLIPSRSDYPSSTATARPISKSLRSTARASVVLPEPVSTVAG